FCFVVVLRGETVEGDDPFFVAAFPGLLCVSGDCEQEGNGDEGGLFSGLAPAAEQEVGVERGFGEEQACEIADDDDDQVTVDPEHQRVMGEIVATEIEEQGFVIAHAYPGRGEEGVGGKQYTGDDPDVHPLAVGAGAEDPQQEDAGNAAGEDGVEGE